MGDRFHLQWSVQKFLHLSLFLLKPEVKARLPFPKMRIQVVKAKESQVKDTQVKGTQAKEIPIPVAKVQYRYHPARVQLALILPKVFHHFPPSMFSSGLWKSQRNLSTNSQDPQSLILSPINQQAGKDKPRVANLMLLPQVWLILER